VDGDRRNAQPEVFGRHDAGVSKHPPNTARSAGSVALGRAVRSIREERDLSQVQLAEATGFIQSWISHLERGSRNPSWNNVVRLAAGLGISVSELAARAESAESN
jgi:DNA-binding XRE family transcriptional regulator